MAIIESNLLVNLDLYVQFIWLGVVVQLLILAFITSNTQENFPHLFKLFKQDDLIMLGSGEWGVKNLLKKNYSNRFSLLIFEGLKLVLLHKIPIFSEIWLKLLQIYFNFFLNGFQILIKKRKALLFDVGKRFICSLLTTVCLDCAVLESFLDTRSSRPFHHQPLNCI